MKNDTKALKENIKRQKIDRMRSLRVAKYIDYPFILPNSPVELDEGYVVADRDTYEVFASFIFKNVSDRPIRKLIIRLDFYLNQNIPYSDVEFEYSQDLLTFGIISKNGENLKFKEANKRAYINAGENFGACVYIPLPDKYFTKMKVILLSVEYAGGQVEIIDKVVAGDSKRYSELDNISKLVYTRVNIYKSAESKFPTKVIPQFGEKGWLCCCGNKNSSSDATCQICGREKEWLKKSVTTELIEETKQRLINDPKEVSFHDKSKFKQNKHLDNEEDVQKKVEQYEKAMKNIAYEEQRKHKRQMMLLPKILIAILIFYLLVVGIRILAEFQTPEEIAESAAVFTFNKINNIFNLLR